MKNCCPLCTSSRVVKKERFTKMLNLQGNCDSEVFICQVCDARYLFPYISNEQLERLYGKSYFTVVYDEDSSLDIPSSNSDYENEFAAVRLSKFETTVNLLLSQFPGAKHILDIGAATGDFLALARKQGLLVSGIELSSYAAAKAKDKYGFVFHKTSILEYQGKEKYDLIHMNHVFEHFEFPHQALSRISDLLNPNGLVYVEVPFQFNLLEVIKYQITGRAKIFDVFSLHHPIFYTPATLRKVFDEHGFTCTHFKVFDWSRYPAQNMGLKLKKIIWFIASLFRQGVMIEAIFQKKS